MSSLPSFHLACQAKACAICQPALASSASKASGPPLVMLITTGPSASLPVDSYLLYHILSHSVIESINFCCDPGSRPNTIFRFSGTWNLPLSDSPQGSEAGTKEVLNAGKEMFSLFLKLPLSLSPCLCV